MERWALVSGLQGDLDLYEQIQKELKQQRGVANLFVLGDLIGSQRKCNAPVSYTHLTLPTILLV